MFFHFINFFTFKLLNYLFQHLSDLNWWRVSSSNHTRRYELR